MSLKMIGSVLVILSFGTIGYYMSAAVRAEERCLCDLISILTYMESELQFRLTPLPVLCKLGAEQGTSLNKVFLALSEELDNQISPDPSRCMDAAIVRCGGQPRCVEGYLRELGRSFGRFDLKGQLLDLSTVRQRCMHDLNKLEKSKESRIKTYQTISLCIGVAAIIILL